MAEHGRDHVSLDNSDALPRSSERTKRLCIVSSKPFPGRTFMAALRAVLTTHDELEIVVNRRREREPTESRSQAAEPIPVDRRHHPHIDRQVKIDGFAIVPAPGAGLRTRSNPISFPLPEESVEEGWPDDLEEQERLRSIRQFKRARTGWLVMWLVLPGLVTAAMILFAPLSAVKSFVRRLLPEASTSENRPASPDQSKPPSTSANPAEVQRPEFPEVPPPVRGARSPTGNAGKLPEAGVASGGIATAPAVPNPRPVTPSRPIANITPRPIADTTTPDAAVTRTPSSRFPGLPRVEVVGAAADAWDRGETYAVRISDTAGWPLAGADVLLYARMADGTVRSIPLSSGPEPGTYQATMPGGSAPVDLRVGITTSDKRVEIPLSP
jgi:hypothetical protein